VAERTVIRGGQVVCGDPGLGDVRRADVLVSDGRIEAVEPDLGEVDAEVIEAGQSFVLPGFVDTHRHLWQTVMRGVTADWSLLEYFWGIRLNAATAFAPEDIHAGTLAGAAEALAGGTTCLIDFSHCMNTPEHADEALRALQESGVRGVFAYGFYAVPLEAPHFTEHAARLADARRLADGHVSGRVSLGVALTEMGLAPWAATGAEVALARELGALATAHTGCLWTGPSRVREVELLHAGGLLDPDQLHVHCNACNARELDLLAEAGAAVSCTPETELQMGMGYPVIEKLLARGMSPSLGCDITSNNAGEMFTQMRLALQANRARRNQPILDGGDMPEQTHLGVRDVLRAATLGGAEALKLDEVCGTVEAGKAADLVVLRADGLHMRPVHDPIASIVLHGRPSDVETVLVGGVVAKCDGRLTGHDPGTLAAAAERSGERLAAALAPRGGFLPPLPEGLLAMTMAAAEANLAGAPALPS